MLQGSHRARRLDTSKESQKSTPYSEYAAKVSFVARTHPQQGPKPEVDDRAIPIETFSLWDARWRFTVDAAALPHNARVSRFWTPATDGLRQDWTGERVWCNPPFSAIRPWVEKALESDADLVVMLLPANRTEQGWWQDLIEPRRGSALTVEFLRGRTRFIAHDDDKIRPNARPPFGCCLVIIA